MENKLKIIKNVYSTVYHGEERCMQNATLLPINNAIVYPNNKILYKKSDNTVDFFDISGIDKSIFFDKGSKQDIVYDNVIQKYNLAKNKLNFNPDEYQCEMIDSGSKFILNLTDDKLPTIIAISDIYPSYFDLGLYTPLYRYIERRPIVTIIDHERKIICVVSVPLDEFTIGQSTICLPIGITCLDVQDNTNQKLLIEFFSNSKSCDSHLPDLSELAENTIIEAINTISSYEAIEELIDETKELFIPIVLNHTECKTSSMGKHSVLIYSGVDEIDYFTKQINPDILIRSMNTHIIFSKQNNKYELHSEYHNMNSNEELNIGQQHFPNLLPMEGGAILFASKTVPKLNSNQNIIDKIHQNIFENTIPIFIIGTMDDLCRKVSMKLKINGIYICLVDYPGNDIIIERNQFLENTCMNGVTAYAGPLSLVLIAIMNPITNTFQYFYVDGIQYENFIDSIPLFGTDITNIIETKTLNYIQNNTFDNSIVDINQENVLFNNELISFSNFKNQMISMTLDEIINNKYKILDVISQCQRIYSNEIMTKYSNELVLLLENKINQVINEYKNSFSNIFVSLNQSSKIKGLVRKLKRNTQELVDKIGLAISKRKQSSIRFNLAQLKKRKQLNISLQDKNLTWFLIYITLAAIDELVKNRKNDFHINNFNDTFSINIRCLLCSLLTYSASGNVVPSFVWQLFSKKNRPDLPKESFEWGLYVRIIEYVQYTGWDLKILKTNIRALLCRLLNKIVIKATESFHTNESIEDEKITEMLNVLSTFANRRYHVGNIHQLSIHIKKNFQNKIFIDKLINCILYKWDNYDRKYKLKLSEFIKTTFLVEQELDMNSIKNQINDFKLKLIEDRPKMLSMIDKDIQPITNHDEIQKLFILIENNKKLSIEELSACLDDIYKNENKFWQPFNPFPQFIEENNIEIYFNNDEKEKIINDSLSSIIGYTTFNSIDEFIQLAKFAGFGQTFEEIDGAVKIILHSLFINCKKISR